MAQQRDDDSASASWESQSNLPAQTDTSAPHHRQKQHNHHQKHHHVGRMHARVPSTKVLHKSHQNAPGGARVNRRGTSPSERENPQRPSAHRRATSDGRFSRDSSSGPLLKSSSQTNLKRNRSHVEVAKRNRSTDKLKRTSSGTGINRAHHKSSKSQVHFDLGLDDEEDDEWVDASGSNSPYLSRKGSLNSSAQSSLRPGSAAANAAALTSHPTQTPVETSASSSTTPEERERVQHKEYLTSRVLRRTPSHGAPPQMTADIAQADLPRHSPESTDREGSPLKNGSAGLTSRFVEEPSSGLTSEGSFYHRPSELSRSNEAEPRRVQSMSTFPKNHELSNGTDESVLVPQPARRTPGPSAQTSRTQQKLNLQRASSVIEPTQPVPSATGTGGASPWIGVGGPGYDGGTSRDPRVGKLLEKTGMEYLVVRRYQNPVARSLNRLGRLPGLEKNKRIPRPSSVMSNGKRTPEPVSRHARNVSMPDPRQTAPMRRVASLRSNGAGSGYEDDDVSRLSERLSGSSLVGDEEDETASMLRNMWERSLELSASAD